MPTQAVEVGFILKILSDGAQANFCVEALPTLIWLKASWLLTTRFAYICVWTLSKAVPGCSRQTQGSVISQQRLGLVLGHPRPSPSDTPN